jgi:hypothetical protein
LDSSIVQGPFPVAPCQTLISRFATFASPKRTLVLSTSRATLILWHAPHAPRLGSASVVVVGREEAHAGLHGEDSTGRAGTSANAVDAACHTPPPMQTASSGSDGYGGVAYELRPSRSQLATL